MFADAYEIVTKFTQPVMVSSRTWDGTVTSGLATFIVLNDEGWFATAAHILSPWLTWRKHQEEIALYRDKGGKPNQGWITNHSFWWGRDGINMVEVHVRNDSDLALGRLEPFDPESVQGYPVLKDPRSLRPGTSLCRLGFPFHELKTQWDEPTQRFVLPEGALPVPLFPIEGIFTRQVRVTDSILPRFIETSSPGLQGQSGGPVFDTEGRVWGIQSRTRHLDLGFSPRLEVAGKAVTEHQFLNVGLAAHPSAILDLAEEKNIAVRVA